ncbi:hypothetical protein ACIBTV_31025 [Micromonospora sp. NPDC049366]|uniref:hypothetical protein n=1 Tax=Micromonospora sp. NPDC049366 TaxID=3364271 RepID=UPI0037ABF49D
MGISTAVKKVATGVAAAGMLTAATLAATSGPAAAAMGQGRVQLCSQGNYASYLSYTGTGITTYVVFPGTCLKDDIPRNTTQIEVVGIFNSSGTSFSMGSFKASATDNPGWKVYTGGTTANAGAGSWWYANRD